PSGTNYTAYSASFTVPAGDHTITFKGTAAEATAFIDAVGLTVKQQSGLGSPPPGPPPSTPGVGAGSPAPVAQHPDALVVQTLYRNVLKRRARAGELKHWERFLRGGGSLQAVALALVTSPAFLREHPGPASFVHALYRDVLARRPDPRGLAAWQAFAMTLGG